MSKRGYYTDALNLINKINESEITPIKERLLSFKDEISKIADKIKEIQTFESRIKPTILKYKKGMKDLYKKEKMEDPLFVFYYLDMLRKLKEAFVPYQHIMVICVNFYLIDKEINK